MSDKKGILVVGEPKDGKLANVTLESKTKARELAGSIGGPVSAVIAAADAKPYVAEAGKYGAERVYTAESAELATFRSGPFADVAAAPGAPGSPGVDALGAQGAPLASGRHCRLVVQSPVA